MKVREIIVEIKPCQNYLELIFSILIEPREEVVFTKTREVSLQFKLLQAAKLVRIYFFTI